MVTGRRFAKVPSALRRPSSPVSGRTLASGADHFGPPMAPSRMASLARQESRVACGSGSPVRSMAAPPKGWCVERELVAEALRDRVEAAHALGGNFRTDAIAAQHRDGCLHAQLSLCRCFVGGDPLLLLQQEAEFIDAIEQAVAREGIDGELDADAIGQLQAWCWPDQC